MRRALALALLLSACSTTMNFEKPGGTQQQLERDGYECERDARQSRFGSGIAGRLDQRDFFLRCMRVRGWQTVGD